jgi:uncharacterized membrane protein YhaH (DUF805 family)
MNYYLNVLKNYAVFSGRARRSEYWYFVLFNIIFAMVALSLDYVLGTRFAISSEYGSHLSFGYIYLFYILAMIIPGLAVGVRRLHDVGKSGWFYFISLIPVIGGIWLLVLFCTEGTSGDNEYGPDPKASSSEVNTGQQPVM